MTYTRSRVECVRALRSHVDATCIARVDYDDARYTINDVATRCVVTLCDVQRHIANVRTHVRRMTNTHDTHDNASSSIVDLLCEHALYERRAYASCNVIYAIAFVVTRDEFNVDANDATRVATIDDVACDQRQHAIANDVRRVVNALRHMTHDEREYVRRVFDRVASYVDIDNNNASSIDAHIRNAL